MARNRSQETEIVTGNQPVEEIPEEGMTAAATPTPVYEKGLSEGAKLAAATTEKQVIKRYRVMADKVISNGGFRVTLRAGKEFDHRHYNPQNLRQQGVQIEEIDSIEE